MQKIEFIMGMPIIVDIVDGQAFDEVFSYFRYVDEKFSPYRADSEVSQINKSQNPNFKYSKDMREILDLAEKTKKETNGYFDIYRNGYMDPSGIVKGWAIYRSSQILKNLGCKNFYINAGGDIQTSGLNSEGEKWSIGISNPFNVHENVKVVYLSGEGIATSGVYERGNHIYLPADAAHQALQAGNPNIVSLTVIAKNVYEADRFATAAFAMGKEGINFVEKQKGLEGYMINKDGFATMTTGFEKCLKKLTTS